MSIRIMTAAWDVRGPLDPTARLVLLSLADQANDDGWCWPALASTARRCGVSEQTVRRWVHDLAELGHVELHERAGRSTMYRVTPVAGDTPLAGDTPVVDDTPTPITGERPPLSPARGEPSKNRQKNRQDTPRSAPGADDALPGMPQEQPPRTAGELVAAWVDGYTLARGTEPLASQVKRMAASARRLADDLDDDAKWSAGLALAHRAGRDAFYDLVLAIPKYHSVQPDAPWWTTTNASSRAIGAGA